MTPGQRLLEPTQHAHSPKGDTIMTKPQNAGPRTGYAKPRITLTAIDHERLSTLMRATMNTMPDVASCLAE